MMNSEPVIDEILSLIVGKTREPSYFSELYLEFKGMYGASFPFQEDQIKSALSQNLNFGVINSPDPLYIPGSFLFSDREIFVTLSRAEVENGILFIGSRFLPYISSILEPKCYQFHWGDIKLPIIKGKLNEIGSHLDIFDIEETNLNIKTLEASPRNYNDSTLYCLDISYLFSTTELEPSDIFAIKIKDYFLGEMDLRLVSKQEKLLKSRGLFNLKKQIGNKVYRKILDTGICYRPEKALVNFFASEFFNKNEPTQANSFLEWQEVFGRSKKFRLRKKSKGKYFLGALSLIDGTPEDWTLECDRFFAGDTTSLEEILMIIGKPVGLVTLKSIIINQLAANKGAFTPQAVIAERLDIAMEVKQFEPFFSSLACELYKKIINNLDEINLTSAVCDLRNKCISLVLRKIQNQTNFIHAGERFISDYIDEIHELLSLLTGKLDQKMIIALQIKIEAIIRLYFSDHQNEMHQTILPVMTDL